LRGQLGRTKGDFRLWQDKVSIPHGELWEDSIKTAIFESVFSIPIVTPTLSKAASANLNLKHFLHEKESLTAATLYFRLFTSPFRRWRVTDGAKIRC
jgi:hypothetical protein